MTLQVGVIGAGLMGTTHARVLSTSVAGAQVAAVSDAIAESATRLADEVRAERVFTDALELIGDPAIDAVIVASPGETHEQFVVACLEAGKPVLCEKPLATRAQAARRVLEAEAALGRRLAADVQRQAARRLGPRDVEVPLDLDRAGAGRDDLDPAHQRQRRGRQRDGPADVLVGGGDAVQGRALHAAIVRRYPSWSA
jgi:myo-inositol 2-dehydrogenase/D-chiro-inositol 1-dehydrogenase